MIWETIEYSKLNGDVPVVQCLQSLSPKHEAKVLRSIQLLEEFGPEIGMPHVRALKDGIFELQTQFSSNIFRSLFFHWYDNKLVLTHGFLQRKLKKPQVQKLSVPNGIEMISFEERVINDEFFK